jgi:hypothetical protein
LEEEVYKDGYESKTLVGWYSSGAKYFEGRFFPGQGREQNCQLLYWSERGDLIHDLTIAGNHIISHNGRPTDEVHGVRFVECGTGGIPPMPIHDDLHVVVRVLVDRQPLDRVLARISAAHEIPIVLDREALNLAGVSPSAPITIDTRALPLHSALHLAIEPYGLTYVRLFDQLVITTWDRIPKGHERSPYDPCGPPERWKNPTGMERYDNDGPAEYFKPLQVKKEIKLENANLETVAEVIGKACNVAITVKRERFKPRELAQTVNLVARHEDAFDILGSALFQLGARAIEREGGIVILPREPLKRRPRAPEPAGF